MTEATGQNQEQLATATTTTTATTTAAATEAAPWYGKGLADEDVGLIQNKGWKSTQDVVQSYRNLEKLTGKNKVALPSETDAPESWAEFFKAAGRPDTVEGYTLKPADGVSVDADLDTWFKNTALENNLTQKQAEGLFGSWNALQKAAMEKYEKDEALRSDVELRDLKSDWGKAYDQNVETARRGARLMGLDENKLNKIEAALGTKDFMLAFHNLGVKVSEGSFLTGDSNSDFKMTPQQAAENRKSLMAELISDPKRLALYNQGKGEDYSKMQTYISFTRDADKPVL